MRTWADVAVLAKTRSLQGGFVAQSAAGLPFLLSEGQEVAFVPPVLDAPRRAHVTSAASLDDHSFAVTFDAVEGIDVAEALVGCHCLVRRAELPAGVFDVRPDAWEGWRVFDASTGFVGEVLGMVELPGQTLLEVAPGAKSAAAEESGAASGAPARTILIPLVDEFIVSVDEDECRIDVDVPSGLLEL